jgi:polyisoprenoid-binding protein YceI
MSTQQLLAGTWTIDALHSHVMVSLWHFNVANLRAKFPGVTGSLEVDSGDPLNSALNVEIDAASVLTGHPRQEEFMRSEHWLDSERFPLVTFAGSGIKARDERRSGPRGLPGYAVEGDLTLKGVTRPIEIPFDFHGVVSDPWGIRAGFTSQFTIDRTDFGISWDRNFDWGLMAGHELTFSLDIELVHPDPALAQAPG